MDNLYQEFSFFMDSENKEQAVQLILNELQKVERIEDFVKIYTDILARYLNEMTCPLKEKICVWREHVRSSIIRTILECAYPHIAKFKKSVPRANKNSKAVIICPDGEYHELGARMAADFFALAGYDAIFVGASTPKEYFVKVINEIEPDIVALSVTNYYNIVSAKNTISAIRNEAASCPLIVVGGYAFINNPDIKAIGADMLADTYEAINSIVLGVKK